MNIKRTVLVILVVLILAIAVNYFAGTSVIINGKQVTDVGQYVAVFAALICLAAVLAIAITSGFILGAVLVLLMGFFIMLFFPLLPFVFLLLPGVLLACFAYGVYHIIKTQKSKKALP